mgnify:CR=1 FL=1
MFASDIHGSEYYCNLMFEAYEREKADKLVLLGDLLYHGPRNDLPKGYQPKKVIELLNQHKQDILCVRGNCEAEVDQMVLEFPVMADYMTIFEKNRMFFITHGHRYNLEQLPPLQADDILIHGHTHVQAMKQTEHCTYLNPGSVSIPKEGNEHSYMVYEDGKFIIKNLEGMEIQRFTI